MDRLEALLKAKGVRIFVRIDQQREARQVRLEMRPTELLLFGNPKGGTPVMNAAPSAALDLPLKALAWEDSEGHVWLSTNSARYLQQRHHLSDDLIQPIAASEPLLREALRQS